MIPWDKSEAYAAGPESSVFHNITDLAPAQVNRLVSRALAFPDLYGSFLDALQDAAASASEGGGNDPRGWLEREIVHEYNQIRDAARADTMKPQTNEQFEQGVVDLLDFARRRSDIVRGEVAASRR
jgi:hypothetical protein